MVGKPNFPGDVDSRHELKGSAEGTPGLTALDEEREASLADEGGVSGAAMETQDTSERHSIAAQTDTCARRGRSGLMAAIGVATAVGALAYRRWRH
ncbi:MAG TPA: hypothetical protein VMR21_13950 [Vicinamibacteria bacterium]|nr:hypothetical protein [Vicinamibacteria bacterium]